MIISKKYRKEYLIHVILVEILSTSISSTIFMSKEEFNCEDLITPRREDLQGTISNPLGRKRMKEVMESIGTTSSSWESKYILGESNSS